MQKIYLIIAMMAAMVSCTREEQLDPDTILLGMGGDQWVRTELDDWLYHEFVQPYNMEVKYKWDPYEINLQKNFVPVDELKVKDLMNAIKKVWIRPYEKQGGADFIKKLAPKRFVLVGTPEYNDQTPTAGKAEGGNKITIFDVNTFDNTSPTVVGKILDVVQHEFVHTLHQNVLYPEEWMTICSEFYTGSWNATPDNAFRPLGFVSKYARANPSEDFAETVSYILTHGQAAFDNYVNGAGDEGAARLRTKESIIVNYFKTIWNIDFYETYAGARNGLVDLIQEAMHNL
ncbi:MAG: putative zinc-binding metallopeptidase [Prevotellaceae bacterium]|nr:putative zinc-binding metallopeptidase [Prevotellaceae bacterium]